MTSPATSEAAPERGSGFPWWGWLVAGAIGVLIVFGLAISAITTSIGAGAAAVAVPVFDAAGASARRHACQSNLRVLDGSVQQWAAADVANVADDISSLADADTALRTYVKDWEKTTHCPKDGRAYAVSGGTFACPNAADEDGGHRY